MFNLRIIEEQNIDTKIDDTNIACRPILHNKFLNNSLKHFITSVTWVFFEPGRCSKVFTGDINPPL